MRRTALLAAALAAVGAGACGSDDQRSSSVGPARASIAGWRWAPDTALPPTRRAEPQPATVRPESAAKAQAPPPAPADAPTPAAAPALAGLGDRQDAALVKAEVLRNGIALPPLEAPAAVRAIFEAGNTIARSPYKWGGGHGKWQDTGYDCSGSVSYALAAAGLVDGPMASGPFMRWGRPGKGRWITIYANPGHMFMVVAGVRFDTVARGETGSRWVNAMTDTSGYVARHPQGL